jgi:hypothetical protein
VIAVRDGRGKLVMESIVKTKASRVLQFLHGLRGELHVTWEEGTWASWLYDLRKPRTSPQSAKANASPGFRLSTTSAGVIPNVFGEVFTLKSGQLEISGAITASASIIA